MNQAGRWIYATAEALPNDIGNPVEVLGGKGASLRKLAASGFPVPPGFTITTAACRRYFELGRQWPAGLMEQVVESVERLECESGRSYGQLPSPRDVAEFGRIPGLGECGHPSPPARNLPISATPARLPRVPLLLAVRSGAAVSMPGMLATLLDCGLSLTLAEALSDARIWGGYAGFIRQLAAAQGVDLRGTAADRPEGGAACRSLLEQYARARGTPFPQERWELLRQSITAVFDSWQRRRAAAFREALGGDPAAGTAVTVQVMLHTDVAGVLFSYDPRDRQSDRLLIEAVQGSGQQLVDGTITPQRFCLDRATLERRSVARGGVLPDLSDRRVGSETQPTLLNETRLRELGRLGLRVEQCFGQPLDIEWGYHAGELVVFQARPLVEDSAASLERLRVAEVRRLKRRAAAGRIRLWVRHNLNETLPSPTRLTWEIVRRWMSGNGGFGRLYRRLGYRPSPRVCRHGFLDLIAGRIYADPDRVAEMFGTGLPLGYDLDALRRDPSLIERAPTRFAPESTDALFLLRLPGIVWTLWQSSRRLKRGPGRAADRFDREILPGYLAYIERERQLDWAALSDADVVKRLDERCARVLDEFAAEALRPGLFGALAFTGLEQRLTACLGPNESGRLARALIAGLEMGAGEDQQTALYRVATGELAVADFLRRFGHRGPSEMELAAPRWREMPEAVSQAADRLRLAGARDPRQMLAEAAAQRGGAAEELPQRLRNCGASSLYPQIQKQLLGVQRLLPYREIGRDCLMMGYELIRQAIEELARRFDLERDVYSLGWHEVLQLPKRGPPEPQKLARRRRQWQLLQRLPLPDTIDVQRTDGLGLATALQTSDADEFGGLSLSNGIARGRVQIVRESVPPAWRQASSLTASTPQADKLEACRHELLAPRAGYVLVCPALDPSFTPMLLPAAGLIVERGGVLSHGAIVARQMGIPAVAVAGAMDWLRDGETVVVDGDRGLVLRQRGPS